MIIDSGALEIRVNITSRNLRETFGLSKRVV